jgi:serine/threonine protein kinase
MDFVPGESRIGQYRMLERLGSGAFGSVWLGEHAATGIQVSIKIVAKSPGVSSEQQTRLARELSLLKKVRHPFIAEFFEYLDDELNQYYVMEFAEHGTLERFIREKNFLPEARARFYFSQIVCVLEYLHNEMHIAHRDLTAGNVLLDRYDNVRVIDFGLSNEFTAENPFLSSKCGSPAYASPEMIRGQPYTQACDVWSAGVLLYVMLVGSLPFEDSRVQRLLRKIVDCEVQYPSHLSPAALDLLRKLLAKDPAVRITIERIKEHHWFSQSQYAALSANCSRAKDVGLDKELVDRMTALGMDLQHLSEHLLGTEYTDIAAIYRMLERQKLTEFMRHVTATIQASSSQPNETLLKPPAQQACSQEPTTIQPSGRGVPRSPNQALQRIPSKSPVPANWTAMPSALLSGIMPQTGPDPPLPRAIERPVIRRSARGAAAGPRLSVPAVKVPLFPAGVNVF